MATKKQRFSIQYTQTEGIITVSACISEEQAKSCGKLLWGLIGGGIIWVMSHLSFAPFPQSAPPKVQSPPQVQTDQHPAKN